VKLLFYVPQMAAYGGMERHVCVLARQAVQRGHQVRLLTTSNSLNAEARAELQAAGVDFRELGRERGGASAWEKGAWLWRQTLAARFTRWDLIYTNGQSAAARIVWKAARRGTRIVHHHHTAADAGEQQTWADGFRRVLADAPEIVACSQATRDNIQRAMNRNTARFLPYFTAAPVAREQVVEKSLRADQPLNVGFAGRLVATKGVDMICRLSRRRELEGVITWQVYGAGEYSADHFKAFPNIRYHGPYRDLSQYGKILRELDALALFSLHNEGMPLSLIEALSAGLPWIASDRGGTRELAESSVNCVLVDNPSDENAVLADVLTLVQRLRSGQTSRKAQRAVYDRRFAPEIVAHAWFDYIEHFSARPTAGSSP
jgi:glycosyltransferase involved in cell wall biosynthesis